MRGIIISLCILSIVSTSILALPPLSTEEFELTADDVECGEHDIILPHPDCTKYYVCINGLPITLQCTAPLYFNTETKKCDHQVNVPECLGGTRPPTDTSTHTPGPTEQPTTDAPVDTTVADKFPCPAGIPHVYVAHPEDCNAFYICRNGTFGGVFYCGQDLWFDSSLQGCVDPLESDCLVGTEATTQPTTQAPIETTVADKFPCPAGIPHVYVAHPEDCNAFYICRNGIFGGVFYCGQDLWFHSSLQGCVDPWISHCPLQRDHIRS